MMARWKVSRIECPEKDKSISITSSVFVNEAVATEDRRSFALFADGSWISFKADSRIAPEGVINDNPGEQKN